MGLSNYPRVFAKKFFLPPPVLRPPPPLSLSRSCLPRLAAGIGEGMRKDTTKGSEGGRKSNPIREKGEKRSSISPTLFFVGVVLLLLPSPLSSPLFFSTVSVSLSFSPPVLPDGVV